jgi:hypothetical protein
LRQSSLQVAGQGYVHFSSGGTAKLGIINPEKYSKLKVILCMMFLKYKSCVESYS